MITDCDAVNEACPILPGAKNRLPWSLEDLSRAAGTKEERLEVFRRVRDEMRERIEGELLLEEGRRSALKPPQRRSSTPRFRPSLPPKRSG